MKATFFSLLLIACLNAERFNEQISRGPQLFQNNGNGSGNGSGNGYGNGSGSGNGNGDLMFDNQPNVSGPDNVVIYQPANDTRIEPVEFNKRSGAPNLNRKEPIQLPNPIDSDSFPKVVPSQYATPDSPTLLVFDQNNAPDGLVDFLNNNPDAVYADSVEDARLNVLGAAKTRPMFDVPKTVTVGVGMNNPPFPGFNNDVPHLPVTTLMKGENPIDKKTLVHGVNNPSIPGKNISPMSITGMPGVAAIPVRSPAVPSQYKLQPGQPKQGLDFSTIAAAPKIDMPFPPIPNVVDLDIERGPWNVINLRKHTQGSYTNCDGPLLNDCLIDDESVIPVAEKIISHDKDKRDTVMAWPNQVPAAYVRSTDPQIIRVDGDVDFIVEDRAPEETLVGSSSA